MQTGHHLMSEERTQRILVNYFAGQHYRVIERCIDDPTQFSDITRCRTHDIFGIDVVAQNRTELWVTEVKGETKGGLAACSATFMAGIGQILTRMTRIDSHIHYALAVPNTDCFATSVRKFINSPVLPLLNLSFILVREDGIIEFLR